jgi:CheY-like chemotaxis protein
VLVADDDRDNAEMLAESLSMMGATVRTALSGSDAIHIASSWTPDVFLLDIGMPDMDGLALVSELRAIPSLATVPAVAVTGYAAERDKQRTSNGGFDGHITKPIDMSQLVTALADLGVGNGTPSTRR